MITYKKARPTEAAKKAKEQKAADITINALFKTVAQQAKAAEKKIDVAIKAHKDPSKELFVDLSNIDPIFVVPQIVTNYHKAGWNVWQRIGVAMHGIVFGEK